jgi:putative transcriptional regulator
MKFTAGVFIPSMERVSPITPKINRCLENIEEWDFVRFDIKSFPIFMHKTFRVNRGITNRIKEIPEQKGIKQTWFADKLGKSIVNAYVCHRRQPSPELLFEIARILQVDPKDLIDSKESKLI